MSNYHGYFREHFGSTFTGKDIVRYRKWFYAQWRFINSKVEIGSNSEILEVGSGLGGFYSFLENKDRYLGIEMDREAVKFSNKFFKTDRFKNISLEKLSVRKKFDLVVAFEVLEHLRDPFDSLEKINKCLKKNGVFCGTSPFPFYKNVVSDNSHLYVLHPANWGRLFLKKGFRKVDHFPMSFFPLLWKLNPKFNIRIPFYVPFRHFISTTLIIAKK